MTRQQILQIFAAHGRWYKNEPNAQRADLTGVDLSGSDFSATNFNNGIFVRSKLVGATMSCANFYGCDFTGADLQRAYLSCADFHDANFTDAILDGANLANADFSGCNFTGASLVNAYLPTCNIENAVLDWDSHDLVAEVLRRAATTPFEFSIAGLFFTCRHITVSDVFRTILLPGMGWAMNECTRWLRDGDNAPAVLREVMDD